MPKSAGRAVLLCAALAGACGPTDSSQPTMVRPGAGIGDVAIGMERAEVRRRLGAPESELGNGEIWEYPRRCMAVTFSGDQTRMVTVGHATRPEHALRSCLLVEFEGGLHFGDSMHSAIQALGPGRERDLGLGFKTLNLSSKGLALRFWNDKLHFVAVSAAKSEEIDQ